MTLDLDGALSPLRGPLPRAAGTFAAARAPAEVPRRRERVPGSALLGIGRAPAALRPAPVRRGAARAHPLTRVPDGAVVGIGRAPAGPRPQRGAVHPLRAGNGVVIPLATAPAPRRMERKHKLMLALAATVLWVGGTSAHKHWRPRAVLIEWPSTSAHAIALRDPCGAARTGRPAACRAALHA
ncbi:hypothetical protein [Methylobacterium crusticola]|nr:hypothetical protein [Methylobacterium crusticola]